MNSHFNKTNVDYKRTYKGIYIYRVQKPYTCLYYSRQLFVYFCFTEKHVQQSLDNSKTSTTRFFSRLLTCVPIVLEINSLKNIHVELTFVPVEIWVIARLDCMYVLYIMLKNYLTKILIYLFDVQVPIYLYYNSIMILQLINCWEQSRKKKEKKSGKMTQWCRKFVCLSHFSWAKRRRWLVYILYSSLSKQLLQLNRLTHNIFFNKPKSIINQSISKTIFWTGFNG